MFKITTVGIDLAKIVFQADGADVSGRTALAPQQHLDASVAKSDRFIFDPILQIPALNN